MMVLWKGFFIYATIMKGRIGRLTSRLSRVALTATAQLNVIGVTMFFKTEIDATKKIVAVKINEILNETEKEFTVADLRNLQTLFVLRNAADEKERSGEVF